MRLPNRRTIRMPKWDYAASGCYFITICTWRHRWTLASVRRKQMHLTELGRIVDETWNALPRHFRGVTLDEFVVMPNHIHGIVTIENSRPIFARIAGVETRMHTPSGSLGAVIRSFKGNATRLIRKRFPEIGEVWKRNYYERIVGDEPALKSIRRYIAANPRKWIWEKGSRR